jgi:hypothetical protein
LISLLDRPHTDGHVHAAGDEAFAVRRPDDGEDRPSVALECGGRFGGGGVQERDVLALGGDRERFAVGEKASELTASVSFARRSSLLASRASDARVRDNRR